MIEVKICTKCGLEKPIEQFQKDKQKKSGRRPDCGVCNTRQCVARAKLRREEVNFNNLKYSTGVSRKEYEELLANQKGVCAICSGSNIDPKRKLSVDHDHKTGLVRGLLCTKCNFGVGYFDDNLELLDKAKTYLVANLSKKGIVFNNKRKKKLDVT